MKRLVLPKTFVPHPEENFSDDGNYFRVLYYKNQLPISVLHDSKDEMTFVSIRLDYLGIYWRAVAEGDRKILDEFNGVADIEFNLDKLISNCEYCIEKYVSKLDEIRAEEEAKKQRNREARDRVRSAIEQALPAFGFTARESVFSSSCLFIEDPDEFVDISIREDRNWEKDSDKVNIKVYLKANPRTCGGEYTPEKLLMYADSLTRAANLVRLVNGLNLSYIEEY